MPQVHTNASGFKYHEETVGNDIHIWVAGTAKGDGYVTVRLHPEGTYTVQWTPDGVELNPVREKETAVNMAVNMAQERNG